MLNELKKELNKTTTENGARAYKSTMDSCLDLFATGGALRNATESEIIRKFNLAFADDELTATKLMFWIRDCRGGAGERRTFRIILKHLALTNPDIVTANINLVSEFGRWDDLFVLFGTKCESVMVSLILSQLKQDNKTDNPSLLAKWMPSINASSKDTKKLAKLFVKKFETTEKKYRQLLSRLRKKIDILETKVTNKEYELIDYSKLPSRAGMLYRQAFLRNDDKRYSEFMENLKNNTTKVNSSVLYPYEIVNKVLYGNYSQHDELYNGMWNNLPDYTKGNFENSISVVDVSGSMNGTPMEVAISLGLYVAERTNGTFKNHFITFSKKPNLVEIKGKDFVSKVRNISKAGWGYNTNLEAVFDLILITAIKNKVKKSELPTKLYIFTDMQFDKSSKFDKSIFKTVKGKYKEAGYKLPKVVFWNINAQTTAFPCAVNQYGFQLVSGFSPALFENLMQDKFLTATEMMMDVLNKDRYSNIKIHLQQS